MTDGGFVRWCEAPVVPRFAFVGALGLGMMLGVYGMDSEAINRILAAETEPSFGPMTLSSSPSSDRYVLPLAEETQRPPRKMQGDARVIVEFVDPEAVEGLCAGGGPGALACAKLYPGKPTLVMPNPCVFPWEGYAVMLCHELGHANGWEHPREDVL